VVTGSFFILGKYYRVEDNVLEPKPVSKPRPTLYAGGESPAAKDLIAEKCDAYLMHGDPPERVREKITICENASAPQFATLKFGVAGYAIVRETEREAQEELRRITDVQQSAAGYANYQQWLAGTQLEQRVSSKIIRFQTVDCAPPGRNSRTSRRTRSAIRAAGVDLLLLQFSPQHEEMERFAEAVIRSTNQTRLSLGVEL